jgi:ankyrin repeat protein
MTPLFPPVPWTSGIEKEVIMSDEPSARGAKRFVRRLPANPNLDKQRKLAKALARAYWRGQSEAIERVRALHPKPPAPESFGLSDAQLVIARGYGFTGWPQMKRKIESLTKSPAELFKAAVEAGDVDQVRQLLGSHSDLVAMINAPMFSFDSPAVHVARTNLELLDLLLANGADLNARTSWEKGGFGVLEQVNPDGAAPLIARGARIDVWAAANLGMIAELSALIAGDQSLVHAKGGDGKRPLHFARTIQIARFLLEHGAQIDALDDDHDSTPAQHLIGDRPEVAGFLVAQGARSDLLLAAALGDVALVRRHLDADPSAIAMRVDQDWFPMIDTAANGGHIYQWTLGFHVSAFDVARKRDHADVLDLLLKRAGPLDRLLDALWFGDETRADAVLEADPQLVARAPEKALRQVADAARNNNLPAVRAMLRREFPATALSQHGATPLHWAAFHGNAEMMEEVLRHNPPIDAQDRQFHGTAMGWLIHGALNPWGFSTGHHGKCAHLLLGAGAWVDEASLPTGHDAVDRVLHEHFVIG